jgi:aerobic carbon-monoxide dehydrogenase medium subunit
MIPASFDYARARTLDEALDLLAGADPSIRVLAGGQSLIPLMKVRLARPERLVDLGRLEELRGVTDGDNGGLRVGALTRWATLLEDDRVVRSGALADVLPVIGDVQVRNMGTIGGSLAHADPASDIAAPALALDFEVVVRSAARGERTIAIRDLFAGPFATTLAPDEILTEVRIGGEALSAASAYQALPQPASGYPIAGVAVSLGRGSPGSSSGGTVAIGGAAIGVTGVGEMPYRATDVEAALAAGTPFGEAVLAIASGQRVASDIHADRDYRAAMAVVMARRAFAAAEARRSA